MLKSKIYQFENDLKVSKYKIIIISFIRKSSNTKVRRLEISKVTLEEEKRRPVSYDPLGHPV